jgi:DnaJ-class molecular chaperone
MQNMMQGANMEEIIKMAQKVATNIAQNQKETIDPNNMDMSKIISQVTSSVSEMMTPDMLEKMSTGNESNPENSGSNQLTKSKICIDEPGTEKGQEREKSTKKSAKKKPEKVIEEIDDAEEENYSSIAPRTRDLHFTLNVTLEELYTGKVKKLAVRRKKIVTDGKNKSIVEEKKKIAVNIQPGMFDEQVITFNKQADEKEGYETGDIIITLCCAEHEEYEREGNNLIIEKDIALSEAYECETTLKLLDGKDLNIKTSKINIFGEEIECYRKLKGYGMPVLNSDNESGDLIIKFKPIVPAILDEHQLKLLNELFPRLNQITNKNSEIKELELATESDFEYSDSDDDSDDDDSDDDDSDSDENDDDSEEEESEEEESEEEEPEEESPIKKKKSSKK